MELTEVEFIKKIAERCGHCNRNCLLPYEYEWTCIAFGYNVIKQKHQLTKKQRKKINFINRLKYAEHKVFCICIDVYKIFEGDDYDNFIRSFINIKK